MKIYTKTGDEGLTSLIDGKRVSKSHNRIEAFGTVDELNSYLGLLACEIEIDNVDEFLYKIQNELFVIGSHLAIETNDSIYKLPSISTSLVVEIEKQIDFYQSELPVLKHFVIPGGDKIAAMCHIARCICRRSERNVIKIESESFVNKEIIKILNRLSDYLFVLARKVIFANGNKEKYWVPHTM